MINLILIFSSVHIKLKLPKLINKHTHVETKYIHVFHPHRHSARGFSSHGFSGLSSPGFLHRRDPLPYYTYNSSVDSLDPRYMRMVEDAISGKSYRQNKKLNFRKQKHRRPSSSSYDDFFYDEPSNLNVRYAKPDPFSDFSDFGLDRRQANSISHPMVDKIFITTPPPPNLDYFKPNNNNFNFDPSFAPPLPPKTLQQQKKQMLHVSKVPLRKKKKVILAQNQQQQQTPSAARLNVRFVKPRFPANNYPSFTTPFPMKRPMFKQSESVKMIQVPMNAMSDNDIQIMLRPKPTLKGGAPASTEQMEHTIKAKTQQTGLVSSILNKKKALTDAIIKNL